MVDYVLLADMESFEYFCNVCGQLRLCLNPKLVGCGHCHSSDIVIGAVGELDVKKMKENYSGGRRNKSVKSKKEKVKNEETKTQQRRSKSAKVPESPDK